MTRPGWDEWALRLAEVVATRADCTRAQVGAVLLSRDHRVLSVGYNGLPAGIPGCATAGNCPRGRLSYSEVPADSDYANCAATHAERNAIEHADPYELPGATLYVTRPPCPGCTTLIEACGIVRVVSAPAPAEESEPSRRCLGCGEYEGDQADCLARQEGHGQHVYEQPECAHLDNQVTLDKADRIAWICTCGARKEHGGEWSTPEKCTHPWPAQSVRHTEHKNRIMVKCMDCEDVKYVEGGR